MIEGEMAFTNHAESFRIKKTICNMLKSILENCKLELKMLQA